MGWKQLLNKIFGSSKTEVVIQNKLSRESIALHEAAHGIVWYLFKNNWTVDRLTIERTGLPDESMNGALHITANFNENGQNSVERANELFAISLAGMIGQNILMVMQRENILIEVAQAQHFKYILDTNGCSGDFEIASKFLAPLAQQFGVNQYSFTKYKVMDLINLFQNHYKVQQLHKNLTQILLEKGTIQRHELISFFEANSFQEYIEDENLDINFFHQR